MKSLLLFTIIFIGALFSFAQKNDSVLALKHFSLFQDFEYEDSLKARIHVDSGLYYAKRSNSPRLIGLAYQFQGWFLQDKSFYQQSNDAFFKALDFFERAKDQQGVANMYGNIGNSYLDINDFESSLDYQFRSLKENEKILENDEASVDAYDNAVEGKTYALHNIGSIYAEVKLYDLALKYEYESLEFEKKVGHKIDVAISYNTLGAIYKAKSIRDSAEYYFKQAIEIYKVESYPYGYSSSLQTYASMDSTSLSKGKRMQMFAEALSIRKEIGDVDFEARVYLDIIDVGMNTLSADSVQNVLVHVHDIIEGNGFVDLKWKYYQLKAKHLSRIGNYKEAFETIKKSIDYEEKTNNKKKRQDLATKEIRKTFETKNYNDSLKVQSEFAVERLSHQKELSKKQNIIYLSVIGFIVLFSSLFFIIQTNKRRKKLNTILSEKNELIVNQKLVVEEKNQSISDSINYAQRLQTAILPSLESIESSLPNNFLMNLPKDIVSGDFYWFEKKNDLLMIAVADCTGHGVPGAMVSVVCSNALNRSVKEFELTNPADILNKTRELVIETFKSSDGEVEDGMDIALCVIDIEKNELSFAGANNPLWVVRNQSQQKIETQFSVSNEEQTLYELKGNKQPIGNFDYATDFQQKSIQLYSNDSIYLFSDGFADQFGGERDKKFTTKRMKELLLEINSMNFKEQKIELVSKFNSWKNGNEQIDDVCILGFSLSKE